MNCGFNDKYAGTCAEPQAEFVSDRNGMNHCEYFQPHKRSTPLAEDLDYEPGRRPRRLAPDYASPRRPALDGPSLLAISRPVPLRRGCAMDC